MKILIVSPYIPWPLYSGAVVRIFNISKELSKMGHEIHLMAGGKNYDSQILGSIFRKVYLYDFIRQDGLFPMIKSFLSPKPYPLGKFKFPDFKNKLEQVLDKEDFDVILVNFSFLADLLPADLHRRKLVILDQHELESVMYQDYLKGGNILEKAFSMVNLLKIKSFYREVFSKISLILSVCEDEAELTKKYTRSNRVFCIPNGVSEDFLSPDKSFEKKENIILFSGNLAIRRNVKAIRFFALKVFPSIKKQIKDAKFYIVGSWPSPSLKYLALIDGVHLIGQVQDIKYYYQLSKVFILPYKFGGGTKIKTFEAMASRIPIVSTKVGIRGVPLIDERHVLISNSSKDFCENIKRVMLNANLSKTLSDNALDLIKRKYLWQNIAKELELLIKNN